MDEHFQLVSDYRRQGDQPRAIEKQSAGLRRGDRMQTLVGVTGSGKTFVMAGEHATHPSARFEVKK